MLKKLCLIMVASVAALAMPLTASAAARTTNVYQNTTKFASAQYLFTDECIRTNIYAVLSDVIDKVNKQTTKDRKFEMTIQQNDLCNGGVLVRDETVSAPSGFSINGTSAAKVNYSGTLSNGDSLVVRLAWKALGDQQTDAWSYSDPNGCPYSSSGSTTTSAPYTVTGSVMVNGTNLIAGVEPNAANTTIQVNTSKSEYALTCE